MLERTRNVFVGGSKKGLRQNGRKWEIWSSDFLLISRLPLNLFIIFAIIFELCFQNSFTKLFIYLNCFFFHFNMLSFSIEYSFILKKKTFLSTQVRGFALLMGRACNLFKSFHCVQQRLWCLWKTWILSC